ncbi:unnamed protein product [Victoria cruziana]
MVSTTEVLYGHLFCQQPQVWTYR